MVQNPRGIENSSTFERITPSGDIWIWESVGVVFSGYEAQDKWCLGDEDPHTYVCMEKQPFMVISS